MDSSSTSHDLLSHFDGQHTSTSGSTADVAATRGVLWVLQWAAALAVLFVAASVLLEFGYLLAAERTLLRAARAGALEATLPRATLQSITDTVERRLAIYSTISSDLRIVVQRNDNPVRGALFLDEGDRLSVSLSASSRAWLPEWLRTLKFWGNNKPIRVRVERKMPGRLLSGAATQR